MAEIYDTIVIGGGVIGMAAAWRLAQKGQKVALIERGECGKQASWASLGVLSPGNPNFKHSAAQAHLDSLDMWPDFAAEIHEASNIDPEYIRSQRMELCDEDQRYKMGLSEVRATEGRTISDEPVLEMLSPEDALKMEPAVCQAERGVLFCRVSAQTRNSRLLKGLKIACEKAGVTIYENTEAQALEWDDTKVTGVRIPKETLKAGNVIIAAGSWSTSLAGPFASSIPTSPVRGQAVLMHMESPPFKRIIRRKNVYVVPRKDGYILAGSTVEYDAGFAIRNTGAGVQSIMDGILAMIPALKDAAVLGMWSGLRPATPDYRPYMGLIPPTSNLYAACGHFKTGLVFAPITAEILCDLITTGATKRELRRFEPGREFKKVRKKKKSLPR